MRGVTNGFMRREEIQYLASPCEPYDGALSPDVKAPAGGTTDQSIQTRKLRIPRVHVDLDTVVSRTLVHEHGEHGGRRS